MAGQHAGSAADIPLRDWPAHGVIERRPHVLASHVLGSAIVQKAIECFGHDRNEKFFVAELWLLLRQPFRHCPMSRADR